MPDRDYRDFYTIRRTEEILLELYSQGRLFGTVHTCIGQEPVAIGVMRALDLERDVVWSNHRGHGHYLAYSDDVEGLVAEVMGRATGICGGVGGSQHLHAQNFYTNGVLGGTVACAVGAALAEKVRGQGAIAVVFMGDGALGEGIVYESLNLAAIWELPILFVLEHNGIAQTTPTAAVHAGELAARAAAFGIETAEVEAADIRSVRAAAETAVQTVRGESRPYFLIAHTIRLMPHSKGDDTRSESELAELSSRDPLIALRELLDGSEVGGRTTIEAEVEQRLLRAVEAAEAAPSLDPQMFLAA